MNERRLRLGVDLFAGLVAASVGIALAGLTWRLAGDPGRRLGAAPIAARPARPVDIAPLIALAPFGAGGATPTQAADQSLLLKGIILASPREASSALVSIGGAAPIAVAIGQQLGTGTVETIERDHLVIAGSGGRRLLAFPDPAGGSPGAAPPPVAGGSSPIASAMAAQAPSAPSAPSAPGGPDPAAMLASLGASPAPGGYRLGEGLSPQLRLSGLQPGDVIVAINGAAVGDAVRDRALLTSAASAGVARLDVLRTGQRLTLTLSLR